MSNEVPDSAPLVRFGRRQSKGVLLGLSGIRLAVIAAGLCLFVLAILTLGAAGAALSLPLWASLLASAFVRWNGKPLVEHAPMLLHWLARVVTKQLRWKARPLAPRPAGTMALPGDAACLRFHTDLVTGAAMIHDPHRQTLAAVLRVSHPAYVLLSPDDQAQRVAAWGRTLAGLAAGGTCAAVQVLESTLPDPGHGITGWWAEHGVHDDSWSSREYQALMEQAGPASSSHRTLITLVLDMKRAGKAIRDAGHGIAGAAEVLRTDMTNCLASLQTAELRTEGWLNADELAVVIRQAYDPAAVDLAATSAGAELATAGPVGVDEHWDHLRHDTGYSSVLWISEWPRIDVAPYFLHSLIFLQGVRKSISIIARPLSAADALRHIRKEKVEYVSEATQKAKIGRIADLADDQEYADVLDRERALIAGHADLRFSGFIAITAPDRDQLAAAVSATARAAAGCGCETRVLYSQQSQAFAIAALPLGRTVN